MKKKMTKYVFVGAALLTGALGFTACSSSDDVANEWNGQSDYDAESNTVKTEFALNIPHSSGTRATAAQTQNEDPVDFLGMGNIHLLEFTQSPVDKLSWTKDIQLGDIASTSGWTGNTVPYKVYNKVSVDVGTSHFLFYGVSAKAVEAASASSSADSKFQYGAFKDLNGGLPNAAGTNTIKFELQPIAENLSTNTTERSKLLATLNAVMAAKVDDNTSFAGQENNQYASLYSAMKQLKAGSAKSIQTTLQNLYEQVVKLKSTDNNNATLADKIIDAIGTYEGAFSISNDVVTTSNTYPRDLNLPDGAVSLKFDDSKKQFEYDDAARSNDKVMGMDNIDPKTICYPAPIAYWVSTAAKTQDSETVTWPNSIDNWKSGFTGWGNKVTANTQVIALEEPINYGVGELKLGVRIKTKQLNDKADEKNGTVNTVYVPDKGLSVTGVIVGGQPSGGVNYAYSVGSQTDFSSSVYDKGLGVTDGKADWVAKVEDTPSNYNYTVLLPSKGVVESGDNTSAKVKFAIELTNETGAAFNGVDGTVPAGATFYLVGVIDPSDKSVSVPEGVTNAAVFMSDYTTTVNATISTLANAYNVIPDLSATNLKLGLAVDLKWKTGVTYNVNVGGE